MWQRESLTRTSTPLSSFQEVVEHLQTARTLCEWPVYFHSATSAYEGALARQGCKVPLDTLQAQEKKVQQWLWRRSEGAPRVVQAVRRCSPCCAQPYR